MSVVPPVQILLATYNGEKYLQAQLDSIVAQTYSDWEILARDDASSDTTLDILHGFKDANPCKIKIIQDDGGRRGFCQNFARLMKLSSADTISFADQDDIWHPDKLEKGITALRAMETEHGTNTPLLHHHDYRIIDEQGTLVAPSFEKKYNTGKSNPSLSHIFVQAIVYGFSSVANRALIDKTVPLPVTERSHDTYLSVVAATFGQVGYTPETLADYRIHGKNVTGGQNPFYALKDFSLKQLFDGHGLNRVKYLLMMAEAKKQDKCRAVGRFLERYGDDMTPEQREMFRDYSRLIETGKIERTALMLKHGFAPHSPVLRALHLVLG